LNTTIAPIEAAGHSRAWSHAIAMGLWLARHQWDHTVVLTSEDPRGPGSFARQFERRLVTPLAKRVGRPVAYFWAVEGDGAATHHHLHALLHGTATLPIAQIRELWPFGTTNVRTYTSGVAASYVTKGLLDARDHYDVSPTPMRPLKGVVAITDVDFQRLVDQRLRFGDAR
jgi:hypothetical protein